MSSPVTSASARPSRKGHAVAEDCKAIGKHDVVILNLKSTGSAAICLRCRQVLSGPKRLSKEEMEALIDFAIHLRDKHSNENKH